MSRLARPHRPLHGGTRDVEEFYERGARVLVRTADRWLAGRVVLDTGGPTVIVGRSKQPKSTKRVARASVKPERAPAPAAEPARPVPKRRPLPNVQSLACMDGCALQRQSRPPTRAEMAEGAWTLCNSWVSSRSAPKKGEPTCPDCRKLLGLESP